MRIQKENMIDHEIFDRYLQGGEHMNIKLNTEQLKKLHGVDPLLTSYNIEITEITCGTFWKAYTPEQIAGKKKFMPVFSLSKMMQYNDPVDLYDERIRKMASGIPNVWVRVSGTWANKTYYDFSGEEKPKVPE